MPPSPNTHFVPYREPILAQAARYIIDNAAQLPDLTDTQIILSEPRAAVGLRRELLDAAQDKNINALLGPHIHTFDQWLAQYLPSDIKLCTQQSRLLILVQALREAKALVGNANVWTLADSLLELFDELTLNRIGLGDDLEAFTKQLAGWYRIKQRTLHGLQHEAQLVYSLWQAWHTQLQAQGLTDPASAHVLALQNSLQQLPAQQLHVIGIEPLNAVQTEWFKHILQHNNMHCWWQGRPDSHPPQRTDTVLAQLCESLALELPLDQNPPPWQHTLARVFAQDTHLAARAGALREHYPQSALTGRLAIFSAQNAEQEAHAIDVQCRQWLIDGKQRIAIVTENRRLARRVRALLERGGILLQDAAGWALSTTRAAATIEALLLCIEDDFAKDALLDLFKSPFLFPDMARGELKNQVYRLEHDIIHNEQITSGLARYQQGIRDRAERLRDLWHVPPSQVIELLERLGAACQPLLMVWRNPATLENYLSALQATLDNTGLTQALQDDAAGLVILQTLQDMAVSVHAHNFTARWPDFRAWLGRNLEKSYFRPGNIHGAVELVSLNQAELQHYDAIILAAAEQTFLPGSPARTPFFNDAVRAQLRLPTREQFNQQRLRQFYRLLHSADSILLSHRKEEDGEPITPSPWLAALESFHQLAYADDLQAQQLHALLRSGQTQVKRWDTDALPDVQTQPRPVIDESLVPDTISASDYQSLLDCPYQFFASRCLALSPPEEIRMALSRREYGERVHLCLQALHSDVSYLPGPFPDRIDASNRAQAIELLEAISQKVFQHDLEDNYTHRGWYHQWRETIPVYIDWQIERNRTYRVSHTEHKSETALNDSLTIKGRLDRIDQGPDGYAIIDYKAGKTPTKTEIINGEKIQLPFYALLAQGEGMDVEQVEYLHIGKAKDFKPVFPQEGEALQQLTHDIGARLQDLMQQIRGHQPLPAWEDKQTCQYCDMATLCRVGGWAEEK